jgi:type IV secretory pathway VirB10-like protein
MLSEMQDTLSGAGPVLLALSGKDYGLGRAKKKGNIFTRTLKKVVKYSPAGLTYQAAKAATAAAKRKREKNIANLKIERANRARKLAEARKRQAEAEAESKKAQAANAAQSPAPETSFAPEAPEAPEYELPMEEITETEDSPADDTELLPETTEEEAEENVETMGYARSNDDYFVGASALKKSISKLKSAAVTASTSDSGQLKLVKKVGTPPNKKLLIVGGLVVGAYLFRKQLSRVFK